MASLRLRDASHYDNVLGSIFELSVVFEICIFLGLDLRSNSCRIRPYGAARFQRGFELHDHRIFMEPKTYARTGPRR